jgi:hypothetical protein
MWAIGEPNLLILAMGINLGDYKRVINLFVCIVVDTEARKLAH